MLFICSLQEIHIYKIETYNPDGTKTISNTSYYESNRHSQTYSYYSKCRWVIVPIRNTNISEIRQEKHNNLQPLFNILYWLSMFVLSGLFVIILMSVLLENPKEYNN
jgi:hypothetical protein